MGRHAGRTNVTVEDVLLLARRNEGLRELLGAAVKGDKGKGKALR